MNDWFRPFGMRLVAVLSFFAAPSLLQAQTGTGAIEGRVFNAATGSALANARVLVEGSNRETLTDESGNYRISGVPSGAARLSVSYLGFERGSAAVNVPAGGSVQRDVELALAGAARTSGDTIKLSEFTVVADREMSAQAIAMNEQRYAPNIKNVVAIDEYGDRGDEN